MYFNLAVAFTSCMSRCDRSRGRNWKKDVFHSARGGRGTKQLQRRPY